MHRVCVVFLLLVALARGITVSENSTVQIFACSAWPNVTCAVDEQEILLARKSIVVKNVGTDPGLHDVLFSLETVPYFEYGLIPNIEATQNYLSQSLLGLSETNVIQGNGKMSDYIFLGDVEEVLIEYEFDPSKQNTLLAGTNTTIRSKANYPVLYNCPQTEFGFMQSKDDYDSHRDRCLEFPGKMLWSKPSITCEYVSECPISGARWIIEGEDDIWIDDLFIVPGLFQVFIPNNTVSSLAKKTARLGFDSSSSTMMTTQILDKKECLEGVCVNTLVVDTSLDEKYKDASGKYHIPLMYVGTESLGGLAWLHVLDGASSQVAISPKHDTQDLQVALMPVLICVAFFVFILYKFAVPEEEWSREMATKIMIARHAVLTVFIGLTLYVSFTGLLGRQIFTLVGDVSYTQALIIEFIEIVLQVIVWAIHGIIAFVYVSQYKGEAYSEKLKMIKCMDAIGETLFILASVNIGICSDIDSLPVIFIMIIIIAIYSLCISTTRLMELYEYKIVRRRHTTKVSIFYYISMLIFLCVASTFTTIVFNPLVSQDYSLRRNEWLAAFVITYFLVCVSACGKTIFEAYSE